MLRLRFILNVLALLFPLFFGRLRECEICGGSRVASALPVARACLGLAQQTCWQGGALENRWSIVCIFVMVTSRL
jgi:hypothetical protein